MCSILGIIDFEKKITLKKDIIRNLNQKLKHRGPDDEGYYDDKIVSFGFNRLSIIDLNLGNQPIVNNDVISIFNGEIFNFKKLKSELEEIGFNFKTRSDSEVVNIAYQAWGPNFIKKLDGMFAIAIYDKKIKKIFLYRDRVGIKPLFYYYKNNTFLFSSEIKGIIHYPYFRKEINFSAIYSYLNFRYTTNSNLNFFKDVHRVKPGHYYEINLDSAKIQDICYWSVPKIEYLEERKESYYLEKLDFLLNKSIKSQMISDVPIGVFLSGGLDSSLISAIANKYSNNKLNTFSVRFDEAGYDESNKTELMKNYLKTNHLNVTISKKKFFNNFENIIKVKDAPISIPHEYPLYELTKQMKGKVKVVLSGEGADELFGGYSRVQKSPFDFKKGKFFGSLSDLNFVRKLFSIDNNFNFKNSDFKEFFLKRYKWFSKNEAKNIINKEIVNNINFNEVFLPWEFSKNFNSNNDELYNSVLLNFQKNHLQCLLDRLDVMTMANSIEARVPFLEHEVIEFINSVPFKYKIRWKSYFSKIKSIFSSSDKFTEINDVNKYLLRVCSKKYLPKKISNEKKLGFPLPMNDWMNDDYVKQIVLDKNTHDSGIFNKDEIQKLFSKSNLNDPYDFNGKKIWMIMNVQLWIKNYF